MSSIEQALRRAQADGKTAAAHGLYLAGEHVGGVSDDQAPIEESTLIRSRKVTSEDLKTAISYDTPYAVVQHENLQMDHDPGRHAKFLENALNSEKTTVARIVATEVTRKIGL